MQIESFSDFSYVHEDHNRRVRPCLNSFVSQQAFTLRRSLIIQVFSPLSQALTLYKAILLGFFFPWHRYFLWSFEMTLKQKCGYQGSTPYWDWTQGTASQLLPAIQRT
jgi:hypothetical protein